MIEAPFRADAAAARRLGELAGGVGDAVAADVAELVARPASDVRAGATVAAPDAAELVTRHRLASARELALLALPVARGMARSHMSGFAVAAVGIEARSGDLLLGANLEFPGTDLGTTVHAEGFVALRARRRGATLGVLAVSQARPCAHCRQTLVESAGADALTLVDLLGHEVRIADLYPAAFRPAALGVDPDDPAAARHPGLAIGDAGVPREIARELQDAGRRAHAPYSNAPSAVALRLGDGRVVAAGCVESVAFNPSIDAIQAALVEVAALGAEPADVVEGWLARLPGASVDPAPRFVAVLRAVAPDATAAIVDWQVGGTAPTP